VRLAGASLALVLAGVSAAGATRPGDDLRAQVRTLDARAHRALLDLYALDSQLHDARARVDALSARAAKLRRERALLTQQMTATRRTLAVSRDELADNLSLLYKEGDISALAVILGATSLNDALTRLDDLDRVADESAQVVQVTTAAQERVGALRASLVQRSAELATTLDDARRTATALAAARAARVSFIAELRRAQDLKRAQIRTLEATAQSVVQKSASIQATATSQPDATTTTATAPEEATSAMQAAGGRTIVVASTGYSLPGHTATGMPVGWGVVAVDPSVIPLGTRLTVPGYGEAVAADTGGAVRGATIDIWFPTLAQAQAWGRRTLTITLH
jgi:cystine transport system substrate-binding protein